MFPPSIPGRVRVSAQRAHVRTSALPLQRFNPSTLQPCNAFTLLELLIVMGIIGLLMVLIVPAFTTIKGGSDVASAASTIKGVLDTARTYAKANDTYTWVGFYEEDVGQPSTNPPTPGTGRLVMSIVASKDGTNVYGSGAVCAGSPDTICPEKLVQVGKLTKIENVHLPLFTICQSNCTGDTFDTRPAVQNDFGTYNYSRFGELNAAPPNTAPLTTPHNFQYPVGDPAPTGQYTFSKLLQFSPQGESRVNGDTYDIRRVVEIGLIQTHGNVAPTPSPSPGQYPGNVVAVQITGIGGNVKIYQR
jgi:prepilin-type N-terminal cleavage/methylation domain-containing protein